MLIGIQLSVLLISIILHEIAHGYVAYRFGDSTAKNLGRLSFNPLVHVDVLGSFIVPGICVLSGSGFFIGWAKPVPVNPRYFSNPLKHMMFVALAGPLVNISLVVVSSVILSLILSLNSGIMVYYNHSIVLTTLLYFIQINLILAVFNLIPIPPLDGSRILMNFVPKQVQLLIEKLEPYGFVCIFVLAYFGVFNYLFSIVLPPLYRFFIPGV